MDMEEIPPRFQSLAAMWMDEAGLVDAVERVIESAVGPSVPVVSSSSHSGEDSGADPIILYGAEPTFTPRLQAIVDQCAGKLLREDSRKLIRLLGSIDLLSVIHSNAYDSAQEMQTEAEHFCNAKNIRLSIALRSILLEVWTASEQACLRQVRARVQEAEAKPLWRPPLPKAPVIVVAVLPTPASSSSSSNPRYRDKVVLPLAEAFVEAGPKEKVQEFFSSLQEDHKKLLGRLWNLAEEIGDDAGILAEYKKVPPKFQQRIKYLFWWDLREVPIKSLRSKLNCAHRWKSWASEADFHPWHPEAWQIRLFLFDQHNRGTSVAKSQLDGLRWLESRLKLKLHADDSDVKASAQTVMLAEIRQATPLSVQVWYILEQTTLSSNVLVAALAAVWLLLIVTSLRYAHLQRSRILVLGPKFCIGYALLSKGKRGGARRPFKWVCPRLSICKNIDALGKLTAGLQLKIGPEWEEGQPTWILPDFGPRGCDIATATTLKARPMPIAKFHKLTEQLMGSVGYTGDKLTSYSARRLFPSLSDMMGYSAPDRSRIGGWASNDKELKQTTTDMSMPNRYSHFGMQVEAILRSKIVMQVKHSLFGLKTSEAESMDWTELVRRAPSLSEASDLVEKWRGPGDVLTGDEVKSAPPRFLVPAESETSESSSSSSSSSCKEEVPVEQSASTNHSGVQMGRGKIDTSTVEVDPFLVIAAEELLTCEKADYKHDVEVIPEVKLKALLQKLEPFAKAGIICNGRVVAFETTMPEIQELSDEIGTSESYSRYHASNVDSLFSAFSIGKARLAPGFSCTKGKVGVWCADTVWASVFYSHCGWNGFACVNILLSAYAGENVGGSSQKAKTNRCLKSPDRHVIAGGLIYLTPRQHVCGQPELGQLHPAAGLSDSKPIYRGWPDWYCKYTKEALGLDSEWKFVRAKARFYHKAD